MTEKNEYQIEAAQMLDKMLRVNTYTFETDAYMGAFRMTTSDFHLCMINNEKYIIAGDIASGFTQRIKTMISKNILTKDDFYYFYGSTRPNCFVKVSKVASVKDELVRMFTDKWSTQKRIIPVIEKALSADVPNEDIPQEELENSTKNYRRRKELLAKSKEYNAEQGRRIKVEIERKYEEERIEREKNEEKTLRSLVSQIEAMGWNVSLTLKDNG